MAPYLKEMRREVLAACDRGEGTRAVALRFLCSESWVRGVKHQRRVRQAGLEPDRLVFIDETWAKTNMTRPRGRRNLPRLRSTATRADATTRRGRDQGQSVQPQASWSARGDRSDRRAMDVPATVQPGLQSDRTGIREVQV